MSISDKIPKMKSCSVVLNRNLTDSEDTYLTKFRKPKMKMIEISPSEVYKQKLKSRIKEKVNYSDDKDTHNESSVSESYDSSSDDNEMDQNQKRPKSKHNRSSPKKLSCMLCEKYFTTHSAYLTHKLSHSSRPFKCILCSKGFQNRQFFIIHMKRFHPEKKPFVCEYKHCEESFKTNNLLKIHRKIHWKYMCRYCKKLFLGKYQMRKHVLKVH